MLNMIRSLAFVAMLPSLALAQSVVPMHRPDPIEVFAHGSSGRVRLDSLARFEVVSAPRATAFDAVVRVINNHVKLGVERADSASTVVYNRRLIATRKLAGQPMSRWLRCGTGMTGEHADMWRITL